MDPVITGVLTALISGLCVAIPSVYASSKNSKTQAELTVYRLNELKSDLAILSDRVDKHNNLVERMALVEASTKSAHKRLDEHVHGGE
ncbi:hypothetical protein [Dielma fastidiosa]|uniref:hypothetical protein n=1 Tax=Dielma fastidiosa TaxID=1034346 RepID=UPI0023F4DCC3|nr:hypothetical protein [Dielma fastidiosa]